MGQNVTPNAVPQKLAQLNPDPAESTKPSPIETAQMRDVANAFGVTNTTPDPRVVIRFAPNPNDLLLSGVLVGGEGLAGRPAVIDAAMGTGHLVMFATRPFWRWETQGSFFLGFNAILNWNDLGTGQPAQVPTAADDDDYQ